MVERIEAQVNPVMLEWARRKSGYDINGAAKRLRVHSDRIVAWEAGEAYPTIRQAMNMAKLYGRPLSAFYLNEPPKDFSIAMTDFRRQPDVEPTSYSPMLIREIRQAQTRREIMLELARSDEEGVFKSLNSISLQDPPYLVAEQIRELLGVGWRQQLQWRTINEALNGWKDSIEASNVLVFHTYHRGYRLLPEEAHGFSISEHRFPVIVVNSKDSPHRRIFTLLHEFTHLLLDAGGVCDLWEHIRPTGNKELTEVFCNHVAANVLVPRSLLMGHEIVRLHRPGSLWTDAQIEQLANDFSTSREVIVRRLLTMDLTSPSFYQQKRQQYAEERQAYEDRQKESPSRGYAPHYRMVLRNNGKLYTRQVLGAFYDNQLTLADVSDYLGAKVKHIKPMEEALFGIPVGAHIGN